MFLFSKAKLYNVQMDKHLNIKEEAFLTKSWYKGKHNMKYNQNNEKLNPLKCEKCHYVLYEIQKWPGPINASTELIVHQRLLQKIIVKLMNKKCCQKMLYLLEV